METHLSFQGDEGIYAEAVRTLELGEWLEPKQAAPLSRSLMAGQVTISLTLSGHPLSCSVFFFF